MAEDKNKKSEVDDGAEREWGLPETLPEIKLPFDKKRRSEIGEWIYDNRDTICITVIVYLLLAIGFLTSRIVLQPRETDSVIAVDFSDAERLQSLEEELRRAQEMNRLLNESVGDYGSVQNAVSNENAEEMSEETREIFDRSEEVLQQMEQNSEVYDRMLADLETGRIESREQEVGHDVKMKSSVTVSFSLANPVRNSVRLPVPSYKCAGGGRVVIDIVVSRNGDVISASVDKSRSVNDNCMVEAAMEMAMRSRFSVNSSAPSRHSGTITYIFVAQ